MTRIMTLARIRRVMAMLLSLFMVFTLLPTMALAAEPTFTDTDGHWGEESIERWAAEGVVSGYGDGSYLPNGEMTRGEFAQVLAKLLALTEKAENTFGDLKGDEWYANAILCCEQAGIMLGDNNGNCNATALISRQEAFVMFARALGIEPVTEPTLTQFEDGSTVSDWAAGYIQALEASMTIGVSETELQPLANINRASFAALLDKAIAGYANEDGETLNVQGEGFILIVADNIIVENAPAGTEIIIPAGVTGVTVNGETVNGGQLFTVPEAEAAPAAPAAPPVHTHSYVAGVCTCGEVDPSMKFYFGVSSSGTTVEAIVYDDYSAVISIPEGTVDSSSVTVTAKMQNVASLGVDSLREHEIFVSTGLESQEYNLSGYLSNAYSFGGATVTAKCGDFQCIYALSKYENGKITATTDTEAARAVWHEIVNETNVSVTTQAEDDSYIVIANGSTLKIGEQMLVFEDGVGDLTLDNFNDLSALNTNVRDHVMMVTDSGDAVTFTLKAGTSLAVGQTIATLLKDVTVTITGLSATDEGLYNTLYNLQQAGDTHAMLGVLIGAVNNAIYAVDAGTNVTVNIAFAE